MEGHAQGARRAQAAVRADRARGRSSASRSSPARSCSPRRSRRRSTTCSPNIYQGTDAVVRRRPRVLEGRLRRRASGRTCRRRSSRRSQPTPGVAGRGRQRAGRLRAGRRQRTARRSATRAGRARRSASAGTRTEDLNPFQLVAGHVHRRADDEIVIDKTSADKGHLQGRRPGRRCSRPSRRRSTRSSASRKFGTADSLGRRVGRAVHAARGAARRRRAGPVRRDLGRRQARRLAGAGRERTSSDARAHGNGSIEVITGKAADEGEPGRRSTRRSASSTPAC